MKNSECISQKGLIIGYVWPEPHSSAAGLRTWNLIDTFQKAGCNLTFASPSHENENAEKLRASGIRTHSIQPNDSKFDEFIRNLNPNWVIFDRFVIEEQFGWRVQENCPQAARVLDTQDLHFLRRARAQALKDGAGLEEIVNSNFNWVTEDSLREIASIYRSDQTLLISDFELNLLVKEFQVPGNLLYLSRFQYDLPSRTVPYEDRRNFVMIGNFRHPPNSDGILWFHREIWPLIRKALPTVQVHIYGAYPPREMMKLHHPDSGFHVLGPTPNQFETLEKYKVNLAPLRFGAGIKGKISDGWYAGTPAVVTPIGAEGMSENFPWGGEIALTPQEFAEKAILLYTNEIRWIDSQIKGRFLLQELYSRTQNSQALLELILSVQKNLASLRRSNFTGAMLHHHLSKSTKYFSKWIEAKNQNAFPIMKA